MVEKYIEELKPYVQELFKDDFTGHDIGHLVRTMNTALYIQEKEGGDRLIIGIAAFLHDVHRIIEKNGEGIVTPKDSIPKVREILSHVDLTEEQVNKINNLLRVNKQNGIKTCVLAFKEDLPKIEVEDELIIDIGSKNDLTSVSKNIFTDLRRIDELNCDQALIEGTERKNLGLSLMNRLIRACENNVL